MRHHGLIVFAVLATTASLLLTGSLMAHDAADLDRHASRVDATVSNQGQTQVAQRTADQLNAQWAPHSPEFTTESVAQQRGPTQFGGWGGVLIGNLVAVNLAKSMLAAPNNTLTPREALALATQQVLEARQGESKRGWGRIAQDVLGQKLGEVTKGARTAAVAVTGSSASTGPSGKGTGSPGKSAAGKTERAVGRTFDAPAAHATGVVVSGPGVGSAHGRGHDKEVAGKEVAGRDSGHGGHGGRDGRGGDGPGGGNGGGGGGGGKGK